MAPSNQRRLLTLARDLQRRRAREDHGLFVAEGVRTVEELLASPLEVRGVLVAPSLSELPRASNILGDLRNRGLAVTEVTEREFASAADTSSPQGVLAVAVQPSHRLAGISSHGSAPLVVLDAVQDPGNVGTILRTAAAFGAPATVALPGTADLWNAKVVRSAMGAHFRHPALHCTWDELTEFLAAHSIELWAADAGGELLEATHSRGRETRALLLGNEGSGLSPRARTSAVRIVRIPITSGSDSLNVAVAAGILLFAMATPR